MQIDYAIFQISHRGETYVVRFDRDTVSVLIDGIRIEYDNPNRLWKPRQKDATALVRLAMGEPSKTPVAKAKAKESKPTLKVRA